MLVSAAAEQALPSFSATTTAVLLGLLISWLVAEARRLREAVIAEVGRVGAASRAGGVPGGSILAVATVLTVGALIALRVQFRGKAESWEEVLVWAALGVGFVGVGFSLAWSGRQLRGRGW